MTLFKKFTTSIFLLVLIAQVFPSIALASGTALYSIDLSSENVESGQAFQATIYVKPTENNISKGQFILTASDGLVIDSFTSSDNFNHVTVDNQGQKQLVDFSSNSNFTSKTAIGRFKIKASINSGILAVSVDPGPGDSISSNKSSLIAYGSSTDINVSSPKVELPVYEAPTATPSTPPSPVQIEVKTPKPQTPPVAISTSNTPAPINNNASETVNNPAAESVSPTQTPSVNSENTSKLSTEPLGTENNIEPAKSSNIFMTIFIIIVVGLTFIAIVAIILRLIQRRRLKNANYYNIDQY